MIVVSVALKLIFNNFMAKSKGMRAVHFYVCVCALNSHMQICSYLICVATWLRLYFTYFVLYPIDNQLTLWLLYWQLRTKLYKPISVDVCVAI